MKENAPLVRQMIRGGLTYKEIGEVFNVTKQRVHQVVKNYSYSPHLNKTKGNHKWSYLIGKPCEVCGSSLKIEIHHKDGNRNNNKPDNLQPLCNKHHQEAEKELRKNGIKKWNYRNRERKPLIHGTITAYAGKNCRCKKCRKASADYRKDYLKRKKT